MCKLMYEHDKNVEMRTECKVDLSVMDKIKKGTLR